MCSSLCLPPERHPQSTPAVKNDRALRHTHRENQRKQGGQGESKQQTRKGLGIARGYQQVQQHGWYWLQWYQPVQQHGAPAEHGPKSQQTRQVSRQECAPGVGDWASTAADYVEIPAPGLGVDWLTYSPTRKTNRNRNMHVQIKRRIK